MPASELASSADDPIERKHGCAGAAVEDRQERSVELQSKLKDERCGTFLARFDSRTGAHRPLIARIQLLQSVVHAQQCAFDFLPVLLHSPLVVGRFGPRNGSAGGGRVVQLRQLGPLTTPHGDHGLRVHARCLRGRSMCAELTACAPTGQPRQDEWMVLICSTGGRDLVPASSGGGSPRLTARSERPTAVQSVPHSPSTNQLLKVLNWHC